LAVKRKGGWLLSDQQKWHPEVIDGSTVCIFDSTVNSRGPWNHLNFTPSR
jgi:hypothetical protein